MGEIRKTLSSNSKLSPQMFKDRVVVEWCEDIHIHFKNLRFELDEGDFLQLAAALAMARNRLWKWYDSPEIKKVPIASIDPYDEGHLKAENGYGFYCGTDSETEKHFKGVQFWLGMLAKGEYVPPILVIPQPGGQYKRLDGFKRFIAMKVFGLDKIPCVVDSFAVPGGQENIEWSSDGKEFTTTIEKAIDKPSISRGERFEILSEYTFKRKVPFEGRTQIELQEDGNIHLHYNNCRFEFRFLEYLKFSLQIIKSIFIMPFYYYTYKFIFLDMLKVVSEYIYKNHKKTFNIIHPIYLKFKNKINNCSEE